MRKRTKQGKFMKENRIEVICKTCGKIFNTSPCKKKRNNQFFCSRECYKNWFNTNKIGKNSPNYKGGKIKKICEICKKKYYCAKSHSDRSKHSYCSRECAGLGYSVLYNGTDSHLWKGGITPETNKRISTLGWKQTRKQVYQRDNWTCQICGYKAGGNIDIHAHHIVPYRISLDDSLNNLITLCSICHKKEEYKYYKLKEEI